MWWMYSKNKNGPIVCDLWYAFSWLHVNSGCSYVNMSSVL